MLTGIAVMTVVLFLMILNVTVEVDKINEEIRSLKYSLNDSLKPFVDAENKRRYRNRLLAAVEEGGPGSDVAAGMLMDLDKE